MNALFFSKYCKDCEELIYQLQDSELYDKLDFICVDSRNHQQNGNPTQEAQKVNQLISRYKISKVPTIVLGNKKATGSNAFNIIKEFSSKKKDVPQNNSQNNSKNTNPIGPQGVSGELFGYSDDYSFLGNDNTPQEKAFNYLNNNQTEEVQEMISVSNDNSQNNNDVNNSYEQMMAERNNFDNSRSIKRV